MCSVYAWRTASQPRRCVTRLGCDVGYFFEDVRARERQRRKGVYFVSFTMNQIKGRITQTNRAVNVIHAHAHAHAHVHVHTHAHVHAHAHVCVCIAAAAHEKVTKTYSSCTIS